MGTGASAIAPARSDDEIRNSVLIELNGILKLPRMTLAWQRKTEWSHLRGSFPAIGEKDAAEKAAKRVYGVKAVANDLEVKLLSNRTDPEVFTETVGLQIR